MEIVPNPEVFPVTGGGGVQVGLVAFFGVKGTGKTELLSAISQRLGV